MPDGDTLVLDSGMSVRLMGLQAPKLPLGRPDFEPWPDADLAQEGLSAMVMGKTVTLKYDSVERDRHGRALAQVFVEGADGKTIWVQKAMIAAGLGRVYSFADNRACVGELLKVEAEARAAARGIWQDDYYKVQSAGEPAELLARVGHYDLVEGRVVRADRAGSRLYLNFGRFWKEDFTAVLDAAAQKLFAKQGFDPLKLEGRLVRLRGWIERRDGPRMDITHPEQIEILAAQ